MFVKPLVGFVKQGWNSLMFWLFFAMRKFCMILV